MTFDPKKLDALLTLDDTALWNVLSGLAGKSGVTIEKTMPQHEELEKLRDFLRNAGSISETDAEKMLSAYRTKGGYPNGR